MEAASGHDVDELAGRLILQDQLQAAQSAFTLAQDGERDAVFDVPELMFFDDMEHDRVSLALVSDPDVTAQATSGRYRRPSIPRAPRCV